MVEQREGTAVADTSLALATSADKEAPPCACRDE
jgi:hypothetical protein